MVVLEILCLLGVKIDSLVVEYTNASLVQRMQHCCQVFMF